MTQLYRAEPLDRLDHPEGCWIYISEGEPITVEGRPMVRLAGGTLVPAEGFHATKEAARAAIAHRVEAWGHKLISQAARLREGGEGA